MHEEYARKINEIAQIAQGEIRTGRMDRDISAKYADRLSSRFKEIAYTASSIANYTIDQEIDDYVKNCPEALQELSRGIK